MTAIVKGATVKTATVRTVKTGAELARPRPPSPFEGNDPVPCLVCRRVGAWVPVRGSVSLGPGFLGGWHATVTAMCSYCGAEVTVVFSPDMLVPRG